MLAFTAAVGLVFHAPLYALLKLSLGDYRYSHVAAIPLVSACVAWFRRKRILAVSRSQPRAGAAVLALGVAVYWSAAAWSGPGADALWLKVAAILAVWIAGFVIWHGTAALRAAVFPVGLLVFVIPIPANLLDGINFVLQKGSAEATYALLKVAGMPVLRDGFQFSLPGIEIEVAEECSGIRSAFALLVTGVLAAGVLLRTAWGRICLVLLTLPIAILKNAIRISTLAWLASNVDEGYLRGSLHRDGGLPFSLLSLAMLVAAVFVLRKWEFRPPIVIGKGV